MRKLLLATILATLSLSGCGKSQLEHLEDRVEAQRVELVNAYTRIYDLERRLSRLEDERRGTGNQIVAPAVSSSQPDQEKRDCETQKADLKAGRSKIIDFACLK